MHVNIRWCTEQLVGREKGQDECSLLIDLEIVVGQALVLMFSALGYSHQSPSLGHSVNYTLSLAK